MKPFEYASAKSKEQAVGLLSANSLALAGGTDLIALMKDEVVSPKRVVNLKNIPDLRAEQRLKGDIVIGALKTLAELSEIGDVAKEFPILREALQEAASPQIRNVATLGGNIMQRPRCWYYRNGMGLFPKDASGESLILKGDNRYHAILGNQGPAYFVSPSSIVPVLISYGAKVNILGKSKRTIPVEEVFQIPKSENETEHTLAADELITHVILTPPKQGTRAGYYEVRQKEAFDWPLATCAAVLEMSGGKVQSAHVVLGSVAPIPWISKEAVDALVGKPLNEETAMAAANAALAPAKSLGKNKYKITVAKAAVKRALLNAAKGGA